MTLRILFSLLLIAALPVIGETRLQQDMRAEAERTSTARSSLPALIGQALRTKFSPKLQEQQVTYAQSTYDRARLVYSDPQALRSSQSLREKMIMALKYRNGDGIAQDYARAATLLGEVADGGELHGIYELSKLYAEGKGVRKNHLVSYSLNNLVIKMAAQDTNAAYIYQAAQTMLMINMVQLESTQIKQAEQLTADMLGAKNVTLILQQHLTTHN